MPAASVAAAAPGVAQRSASRWVEAWLQDLERELLLAGEDLPTLEELDHARGAQGHCIECAEPQQDLLARRAVLELHTRRICEQRVRGHAPVGVRAPAWPRPPLARQHLPEQQRRLVRHEERLTALGAMLREVGEPALRWREEPTNSLLAEQIGAAALRFAVHPQRQRESTREAGLRDLREHLGMGCVAAASGGRQATAGFDIAGTSNSMFPMVLRPAAAPQHRTLLGSLLTARHDLALSLGLQPRPPGIPRDCALAISTLSQPHRSARDVMSRCRP